MLKEKLWLEAHIKFTGGPASYLEDVDTLWEIAINNDNYNISIQSFASLCFSSVSTLGNKVNPELIVNCYRAGIYSLVQALYYSRQKKNFSERARALALLANERWDDQKKDLLEEALDTAKLIIDDSERVETISLVLSYFPVEEALFQSNTLPNFYKARLITRKFHELSKNLQKKYTYELIEIIKNIKEDHNRINALGWLINLVDVTSAEPILEEINTIISSVSDKYYKCFGLLNISSYCLEN